MSKQRAAKHQGSGWINVEEGATVGARLGENLFDEDGNVLTLAQLIALAAEAVTPEPTPLGDSVPWRNLIDIPVNVQEVVDLATAGLVVRQTSGDWITRALANVAGETTVANGSGDAGSPAVGLADVTPGASGALLAVGFDAKGRRDDERAANQADIDAALGYPAVESVVAGTNVSVDATDPRNPIVSATGGGGGGGLLDLGSPATASGTDPLFDFGSP